MFLFCSLIPIHQTGGSYGLPKMQLQDADPAPCRGLAVVLLRSLLFREDRGRKQETGRTMQLWDFPHIKVRVSCTCGYKTAYKLVRLGELYGARTELGLVLERLMVKCPMWGQNLVLCKLRCGLIFTDLNPPPLKIIAGGRK